MKKNKFQNKVSLLMREGYPQKQALAIAFSYKRKNKLATGGRLYPDVPGSGEVGVKDDKIEQYYDQGTPLHEIFYLSDDARNGSEFFYNKSANALMDVINQHRWANFQGEWTDYPEGMHPPVFRFDNPDVQAEMKKRGFTKEYINSWQPQNYPKQNGGNFYPDEPPAMVQDATYMEQMMPLNESYVKPPRLLDQYPIFPEETMTQGSNTFADRAIDAFRTKVPESWRMVMPGVSDAEDVAYFTNAWSEKGHPGHKALSAMFLGIPFVGSGVVKKFAKKGAKDALKVGERSAEDLARSFEPQMLEEVPEFDWNSYNFEHPISADVSSSPYPQNVQRGLSPETLNQPVTNQADELAPPVSRPPQVGEPTSSLYDEVDFGAELSNDQLASLNRITREPRTVDELGNMTVEQRRSSLGITDNGNYSNALIEAGRQQRADPSALTVDQIELLNTPEGRYVSSQIQGGVSPGSYRLQRELGDYIRRAEDLDQVSAIGDVTEEGLRGMTRAERISALNTISSDFETRLERYIHYPDRMADDPVIKKYLLTPEGKRAQKLMKAKDLKSVDVSSNIEYFGKYLGQSEKALRNQREPLQRLFGDIAEGNMDDVYRSLRRIMADMSYSSGWVTNIYRDILHAEGIVPITSSRDDVYQGLKKVFENPEKATNKKAIDKLRQVSNGDYSSVNEDILAGANRKADLDIDFRRSNRVEHGPINDLEKVFSDNKLGHWKLKGVHDETIEFSLTKPDVDADYINMNATTPHASIDGTLRRNAEGGYDISIGTFSVQKWDDDIYTRTAKGKLAMDKKVTDNNVKILNELIDGAPPKSTLHVSSLSTDSMPLVFAMLARKGKPGKFTFNFKPGGVDMQTGLNEMGYFSAVSEASGMDLFAEVPQYKPELFNPDKLMSDVNRIIDTYKRVNADDIPNASWTPEFENQLDVLKNQIKDGVPPEQRIQFSRNDILSGIQFPRMDVKKVFPVLLGAGYIGSKTMNMNGQAPEPTQEFALGGEAFGANDYYTMEDLYKQYGKGGAALSGAASGAMTGMALGPWGAAAGAVIGGISGFLGAENEPEPYFAPISKEKQIYQGLRAMGGKFKRHDYEGLPHEMGGIKMPGPGVEVENNETRFNNTILSDRIKLTRDMYNKYKGLVPGLTKKDIGRSIADIGKSKDDNRFKEREGDLWNDEAREVFNMPIQMMSQELAGDLEGTGSPAMGPYKRYAPGGMWSSVMDQFKGDPLGTAPIAANLIGAGITALTPTEKVPYHPARFTPTKITPISTRTGENAIRRAGQNFRAAYKRQNPRKYMTNAQGFFATEAEQIGDLQENIAASNAQMTSQASMRDAYSRNNLNQYNSTLATSVDEMNAQNRAAKANALSAQFGKFSEGLSQRASDIKRMDYQDKHNQELMDFYREIYGINSPEAPMASENIYEGDMPIEPWMTEPFAGNDPNIPVEPWMTKPFTTRANGGLMTMKNYSSYCGGGKFKRRK